MKHRYNQPDRESVERSTSLRRAQEFRALGDIKRSLQRPLILRAGSHHAVYQCTREDGCIFRDGAPGSGCADCAHEAGQQE